MSHLRSAENAVLQHPFYALTWEMQPQPILSARFSPPAPDRAPVTLAVTLNRAAAVTLDRCRAACAAPVEGDEVGEVCDPPIRPPKVTIAHTNPAAAMPATQPWQGLMAEGLGRSPAGSNDAK